MYRTHDRKLPVAPRRRARKLAIWNGAVWAIGNGLASTTLVIYLAKELHAERLGLGISLIVAAPQIAGLLRLGTPALIDRLGDRKRFCIAAFLVGALLLLALPWVCAPGRLPSPGWSLLALVLLWCLYHLLQYLGTVALWSWLADVAAAPIRGRFLGRRERWLVAGQAAAAIAAGWFVWQRDADVSEAADVDSLRRDGRPWGGLHDRLVGPVALDAVGHKAATGGRGSAMRDHRSRLYRLAPSPTPASCGCCCSAAGFPSSTA